MMARLEEWVIAFDQGNPFMAPELCRRFLAGVVFGHCRMPDNRRITTSYIDTCTIDPSTDKIVVTTESGSVYELGKIDPGYEKAFPGAEERLRKTIMENKSETH